MKLISVNFVTGFLGSGESRLSTYIFENSEFYLHCGVVNGFGEAILKSIKNVTPMTDIVLGEQAVLLI